jgi:hypothetical protein
MDIVVLTAPDGKAPAARFPDKGDGRIGGFAGTWRFDKVAGVPPNMSDLLSGGLPLLFSPIRRLPAVGRGFSPLDRFLPFSFDLPIVGEEGREGDCAIQIDCFGPRTTEDLFRALRDDPGILATEERRDVEMLVVRQESTAGGMTG